MTSRYIGSCQWNEGKKLPDKCLQSRRYAWIGHYVFRCLLQPRSVLLEQVTRLMLNGHFFTAPLPGPTTTRETSACSTPKAPMPVVRMSFRTFSFHPSRNRCRTGSRGSLCPSSHQRPDTLPLQRSAGHILSILALYTCAITTAAGLTMQSDGKFFTVRIRYLVKSVLQRTSAGFNGVFLCPI